MSSNMSCLRLVKFAAFIAVGLLVSLIVLIRVGVSSLFEERKKRKERKSPPSCMTDLDLEVMHDFVTLDDVTLHYVSAGDPKSQLMIFLHGFPDFWFTWQKQIPEFKKDYWVVAPDMRGCGESSKPESVAAYKLPLLVHDIRCLIEKLGKGRQAVVVGHDWGGIVAWSLAAFYPALVHHLIIINAPHPQAMSELLCSSLDQMKRSWYIVAFQFPMMARWLLQRNDFQFMDVGLKGYGSEELEALKYTFSQPGVLQSAMNYYRANFFNLGSTRPGSIQVPTLIIWGENDTALSSRLARMSMRWTSGRLELLPDVGHWAHRECPENTNQHIRSFLEGREPWEFVAL
ncbi:epoxide hydrolase 4-like [Ornithodoros turicata]|uniref:epoxide hydrolase 4-like n=1 Tax=Ornithodoros turicata TaxID=34597 RepID=UPI0031388DED